MNPELTSTVGDFEQMVVEQDVGLVLQFEPYVKDAELLATEDLVKAVTRRGCEAFAPKMPSLQAGGNGFTMERGDPQNKTVHYSYNLPVKTGPRAGQVQVGGWVDDSFINQPS